MAENARSPLDKDAWLRLADSWLQMLPKRPETQAELPGRPEPSDDDLKESH
jgi:hypothetical protein